MKRTMSSAPQSDNDLRERLRERISQKSDPDEHSDPSESEGDYGDDDDEDDDEEMESEAVDEEAVEEASQMISDAMGDDIAPGQVMELLEPLMGEDTRDDDAEMAADTESEGDTDDAEADGGLSEADVADMIDEQLDEKLDGVVDALADETRSVMQKAEVGGTPSPTATGGASGSTALFSDERGEN